MNLREFLEGTITNPIIIKELRATFRGQKFFLTFLGVLGLFSLVLLGTILGSVGTEGTISSQIGQAVFLVFLGFVFLVSVFVFPAFSCTAIVSEREKKTYEMLLVTGIQPWELVLGKFLACMCYVITFISALLPLVFVCFLFGGVGLAELAVGVSFTLGVASAIVMATLFVSSLVSSARVAVMVTYGPLLFAATVGFCPCLCCSTSFLPAIASGLSGPAGMANVLLTSFGVWLPGLSRLETFAYLFLAPVSAWALTLAFFYLLTTNRLRPAWANRSTPLRIFYLVFLVAGGLQAALILALAASGSAAADLGRAMAWFWTALGACLTLALAFPTESPILSYRLREDLEGLAGKGAWRRLIFPGPGTGMAVAWGGAAVACVLSVLALSGAGGTAGIAPAGLAALQAYAVVPLVTGLFFLSALALLLGTFRLGVAARRGLVFGAAVALAVLPFAMALADPRGPGSGVRSPAYELVSGFGLLLSAFDLYWLVPAAAADSAGTTVEHWVGPTCHALAGLALLAAAISRRGVVEGRLQEVVRRETTIIRRKRGPAAHAEGKPSPPSA